MHLALQQAMKAYQLDEVPVGAIIVKNNIVIGEGCNQVIANNSVSSHAEINAINNASKYLKNYRLVDCDIYVTLEPCHMCAKAIVDARIKNLYFGAAEPKSGAIISVDNFFKKDHRIRIEVSSSNFPRFARNLNTGGNNYDESEGIKANNVIYHSKKYPSNITLPIVLKNK